MLATVKKPGKTSPKKIMNGNTSALLDTNAVVDYFRKPETIETNFDTHDLYICDVVLGELFGEPTKALAPITKNK